MRAALVAAAAAALGRLAGIPLFALGVGTIANADGLTLVSEPDAFARLFACFVGGLAVTAGAACLSGRRQVGAMLGGLLVLCGSVGSGLTGVPLSSGPALKIALLGAVSAVASDLLDGIFRVTPSRGR